MPQFSIAAQDVHLPDGSSLGFRVNAADTSQVELHISGRDSNGAAGTHILVFNRNGGQRDTTFVPAAAGISSGSTPNRNRIDRMADGQHKDELGARMDAADAQQPLDASMDVSGFKSVDEDAVRGDPQRPLDPRAIPTEAQRTAVNTASTPAPGQLTGVGAENVKVSPVHGVINTVGMDSEPVKPPEGNAGNTPLNDRRDHAAVGIQPSAPASR